MLDSVVKNLPYDSNLERVVLGSMIANPSLTLQGIDLLTSEAFYSSENRITFEVIRSLNLKGLNVDLISVMNKLDDLKELDKVGGPSFVMGLTSSTSTETMFEQHCLILREKQMRRMQIDFGRSLIYKAEETAEDVFSLNEFMADRVHDIVGLTKLRASISNEDHANELTLQIEKAGKLKGITGLPTGIHEQDRVFGGWQPTELIVIGARPGMGKTAKMLSEVLHQIVYLQKRIVVFSLEMSARQMFARLASMVTEIDSNKFKTGDMNPEDWEKYNERIGLIITDRLVIVDDCYHIHDIRTRAKKERMDKGVDGIYIDYLQIAEGPGHNRENQVSYISRQCKMLAKELEVPVIALSQLGRGLEQRGDHRPRLSDLRESGAIEQDADIVCFIHRPSYYGEGSIHLAYLIIAKNRNGSLRDIELMYIHRRTHFLNPDQTPDWIE